MKNAFTLHPAPCTLLLILFLLASCSDDSHQPAPPSAQNLDQFMQQIRLEAFKNWEDSQEKLLHKSQNDTDRGPGETAPCNCSYRITHISYSLPAELPEVDAELASSVSCDEENPFSCGYFTGAYFSGDICGVCNFDPNCCDWWEEVPHQTYFPFNCQVPAYSTFPVFFGIAAYETCTSFGDVEEWSVTYRIVCQESEPNTSCGPGGGYGFMSDPITVTYPGNADHINYDIESIELEECGCKPVLQ